MDTTEHTRYNEAPWHDWMREMEALAPEELSIWDDEPNQWRPYWRCGFSPSAAITARLSGRRVGTIPPGTLDLGQVPGLLDAALRGSLN